MFNLYTYPMKTIFTILTIALFSCSNSLSDSKKASIKLSIDLHNVNTSLKYKLDSIDEATNYKIRLFKAKIKEDKDYTETHMAVFANQWNDPYDIQKDRFLTVEKYLDYCKANGLNAESYHKFLD